MFGGFPSQAVCGSELGKRLAAFEDGLAKRRNAQKVSDLLGVGCALREPRYSCRLHALGETITKRNIGRVECLGDMGERCFWHR